MKNEKRSYTMKRSTWVITLAVFIILAVFVWVEYLMDYIPLQGAIAYTTITPVLIFMAYALRRFWGTSLTVWRLLYIFGLGVFCVGSVLWVVSMIILRYVFGWGADPAALLSIVLWWPMGGYIGDRLGKRRNYMPTM
jgi:hypothetical protein